MRIHLRETIIALLGLCTVACSDTAGPLGFVSLCPDSPWWAGIQREGKSWETIPGTPSAVSLQAGERIGLARILLGTTLEIYYVTAEQAEGTFSCEAPPTKELHGTTKAAPAPGSLVSIAIAIGDSRAFAGELITDYTLRGVQNGAGDLVATRYDVAPATIIRRGVNYPEGSAIPLLDFTSGEPFSLQTNTLTVTGPRNTQLSGVSQIITQNGTLGMLAWAPSSGSTLSIYSVPGSRLVDGDLQSVTVSAPFARTATLYYRLPSDRTLALGPLASIPIVTRTDSPRNLRIEQPSQPEYGSQVRILICMPQPANPNTTATIVASKEYFGGTPATWSFTVPDFPSVQGFPASWPDPRAGNECEMIITDRPYLFSPRSAHDGDTHHLAYATR